MFPIKYQQASTLSLDNAFITTINNDLHYNTGLDKLDHEDYAIKCWVADNFMNIEIHFLPLIL